MLSLLLYTKLPNYSKIIRRFVKRVTADTGKLVSMYKKVANRYTARQLSFGIIGIGLHWSHVPGICDVRGSCQWIPNGVVMAPKLNGGAPPAPSFMRSVNCFIADFSNPVLRELDAVLVGRLHLLVHVILLFLATASSTWMRWPYDSSECMRLSASLIFILARSCSTTCIKLGIYFTNIDLHP
eukprot:169155-Pleurochrysis_carterae.AAC.1